MNIARVEASAFNEQSQSGLRRFVSVPLLLIEDDTELAQQLCALLTHHGFEVTQASDGEQGAELALEKHFGLILLDVRLPSLDGLSVLQLLRQRRSTPVIILSAWGAEQDRITGLRHGADDYLAKPFNWTELMLRIEAVLRRSQPEAPGEQQLNYQQLQLNISSQQLWVGEQQVELTPVEARLLWQLMAQPQQLLSKRLLYPLVLERSLTDYDRSLDMHWSRLKRKLVQAGFPSERLITVHGKGYRLI
ncbi:response regulator transcription factor [Rheinheimera sediminis]|jgi:DNA-binding response OmpR family regulator|uniref:response regulator transcription factor n=1 Tax=Rheinheimera sp. YQF-1 TaxID=2499626 RepID=UPI000FD95A92|nr:response regulator transcription factor [Rheinheimera sp. YQF-1]RVT45017.1 response regulator transcription factor [Rheinheimera sp. YQF-1]